MMRFRIVCRPCAENIEAKIYDVEERLEIQRSGGAPFWLDSGELYYWSFVETFGTFYEAEQYADKLVGCREVVKEYY